MSFKDWNWDEFRELPRWPELMRFTLYYDGPLPSAANEPRTKEKHSVRERLHWQLLQLFRDHPELPKPSPKGHDWYGWSEWKWPLDITTGPEWTEKDAVIEIGDLHFLPLVRESLHLVCELDILFLRPGTPGLMERGTRFDIDNRLLTLFDALTVPTEGGARDYAIEHTTLNRTSPIFCLLGDDCRITAVNVRTDSLLTPAGNAAGPHDVRLIIGVTVKATALTWANLGLAG